MKVTIDYDDDRLNTLHRLRRAKPFREFDVVTNDGRKYHVEKPFEFAFDETRVVVANEKKSGIYRLPLHTVQSIEEQTASNGT